MARREHWPAVSHELAGGRLDHLSAINAEAGDPHRQGRSVIVADFAGGERVVYKPRSLALDGNLARLIVWTNAQLPDLTLGVAPTVDRTSHGWAAFIALRPAASPSEVARFYRRQGANLALAYLLGGCDLHSENVIAAAGTPVLVDIETWFHPVLTPPASDWSVLATGLLPDRSAEDGADLSGMGNAEKRELPYEVPVWQKRGSDVMRLALARPTSGIDRNLPILAGRRVAADGHVDEVVDGFTAVCGLFRRHREALLAPDGALAAFRGDIVRVVVRPTLDYALLLEASFDPSCLLDERARQSCFEELAPAAAESPLLARLAAAERRDLLRGDIPLFSAQADGVDLWTSDGERIVGAAATSG